MIRKGVVGFSALLLAGGMAAAQEHGGKIDWIRNPAFGQLKARIEQRAQMLYFTASW